MASASKGLSLAHTEKLKPMIKSQISGRMLSGSISDVVFTPVYSEKTRLKKCLIMIIVINRKKRRFLAGARN